MNWNILVIGFLYFGIISNDNRMADAWRPFELQITGVSVKSYPDMLWANASVVNNSAGYTAMSGVYLIKKRMEKGIMLNIVGRQVLSHLNRPYSINNTVNICAAFKVTRMPPIASGIFRNIMKSIDMPLKCPVEPGLYRFTEMGAVTEELPPYIPFNTYKLNFHFYVQNKTTITDICKTVILVKIVPNKNLKPKKS